jgi:peptidoglycan/xylan/chitin deacetylase (PgdA/CDA1 family)
MCQREFGRCDSDMFPTGPSTLKDPRPQLGKNAYGKYIMDCKVPGTVAMTFDDGPNVYTGELLDKLLEAGAKATFFVGGNNNGRQVDQGNVWPSLVRRILSEGHQIASHTWSHPHMNAITTEDRKLEMAKTERAIANIIGKYPTYMRPPYSQCDEKSGCQKDMKDMGYSIVGVPFDTLDWKNAGGHIQDSTKEVEEFFDKLTPDSHPIVCQHDFLGASVHELTPVVLDQIKAKGLKAVTLGECLGDDVANWYRKPGTGESWI